jgi:hypothetical protein
MHGIGDFFFITGFPNPIFRRYPANPSAIHENVGLKTEDENIPLLCLTA